MPKSLHSWTGLLLLCLGLALDAGAQTDAQPSVLESAICTGIEDRMPVGSADTLAADSGQIYCWTRIGAAAGQNIVHAWIHGGTTRARVEMPIGGDNWRVFSSKRILPEWTGAWEVKVLTQDGAVLASIPFFVR
jgi:hypothetical protein